MGLISYVKKRKFSKTPEPKGKEKNSSKKNIYTIQKHYASHLHWDLRLEMQGVLKSWAVPKQPPKTKGTKRLAIKVEDHPLSYAKFKGTIPEGNYGAGKVEIWDKGTYELIEKKKDVLVINIHGEKLKGEYCLVKVKFQGRKNNWLFMKK